MKSRTIMMGALICAVALLATFEYSGAAQPASSSTNDKNYDDFHFFEF